MTIDDETLFQLLILSNANHQQWLMRDIAFFFSSSFFLLVAMTMMVTDTDQIVIYNGDLVVC